MSLVCDKCGKKLGRRAVCESCGTIKIVNCSCGRRITDIRYKKCQDCRESSKSGRFIRSIVEFKVVIENTLRIVKGMIKK